MAQLINEAKRMQLLAGLITESQLEEGIASVDHLEVGQTVTMKGGIFKGRGETDYNYKGEKVQGKEKEEKGGYYPPYKVKVIELKKGQSFVGELLEDNETTEYKGFKKGEKLNLNTTNIIETSDKQLSALNPIVAPKNDDEENPKSTEAFNKVVAWAKENKLRTINQGVNEYGPNDIYIRNWKGGPLDVIISTSREEELKKLFQTLGGKMQQSHMDEETKGARIGLNFEGVKESLNIDLVVNEALAKVRKAGK